MSHDHVGTLVQKPFRDKRGNVIERHQDVYLQTEDRELFVKVCASDVSKEELRPRLGERVAIEGTIEEGTWACDPRVQSRLGPYLVVESIRRLE